MKVYVAYNIETRSGEEKEFFQLGVFTTREKAMTQLALQAHTDLETYNDEDFEDENGSNDDYARHFDRHDTENGFVYSNGEIDVTLEYWIAEEELDKLMS